MLEGIVISLEMIGIYYKKTKTKNKNILAWNGWPRI